MARAAAVVEPRPWVWLQSGWKVYVMILFLRMNPPLLRWRALATVGPLLSMPVLGDCSAKSPRSLTMAGVPPEGSLRREGHRGIPAA